MKSENLFYRFKYTLRPMDGAMCMGLEAMVEECCDTFPRTSLLYV